VLHGICPKHLIRQGHQDTLCTSKHHSIDCNVKKKKRKKERKEKKEKNRDVQNIYNKIIQTG